MTSWRFPLFFLVLGVAGRLEARETFVVPATRVASERVAVVTQAEGDPQVFRRSLEKAGLRVLLPLPPDGWLVRGSARALAKAEHAPGSSGVREWTAESRVAALLRDELGLQGDDRVHVRVSLMPGEDLAPWRQLVAETPGAKLDAVFAEDFQPGATLWIDRQRLPEAIAWLSHLRDVFLVETAPAPRPMTDHAAWWIQTGEEVVQVSDYSVSAKLWARGLTGRGLFLGLADDGIETDSCALVYANDVPEACWPLGPAASAPAPIVAEESFASAAPVTPTRTRERKVAAYLIQPGAAAYSSPYQHGTTCAAVAVGDDPVALAARPLVRDLGEQQDVAPWRPGGSWTVGDELRSDLAGRVDNPLTNNPLFPNTFGPLVEHHQSADGMAPGAQVIFQDIGDAAGTLAPGSVEGLLRQASRYGATTWLVAWGGGPCTNCYGADAAGTDYVTWERRDLVVVAAAGNDGQSGASTIIGGVPQSRNAVVVGGSIRANMPSCLGQPCPSWTTTHLGESMEWSSSAGPASGGRIGPQVIAPFFVVSRAFDQLPVTPEDGTGSGDFACVPTYEVSGTSFAASIVAGASLLVQQYFLDGYYPRGVATPASALRPTNALVKAILVSSTRNLHGARTDDAGTGQADRPTHRQGFGGIVLDDTLYFAGDPVGTPDRATIEGSRLLVVNDVPNGYVADARYPLTPEPGGQTRDQILAAFHPALATNQVHEFFVNVQDTGRGEDLRFTLAWSDVGGGNSQGTLVNDIDLEVVSPGPNGLLETSAGSVRGDDIVYRPNPANAWAGGYTTPSPDDEITSLPSAIDYADRDSANTVENVFVRSAEVRTGTWCIRVLGRRVAGALGSANATPNFRLNDTPLTRDADGDTVADTDERDIALGQYQGYALIASGPLITGAAQFPPLRVPLSRQPPRIPRPVVPQP